VMMRVISREGMTHGWRAPCFDGQKHGPCVLSRDGMHGERVRSPDRACALCTPHTSPQNMRQGSNRTSSGREPASIPGPSTSIASALCAFCTHSTHVSTCASTTHACYKQKSWSWA